MKSIDWLMSHGRPLDIARFKYHFENASVSVVLEELKKYQNADGGFGHGLEPDVRNPDSSPIACWAATELLTEIGCWNKQMDIVSDLVAYLSSTIHKEGHWFKSCIESNNDYPRAIWWNYDPDKKTGVYNPSAALYGFLFLVANDFQAKKRLEEIFTYFINDGDLEMHDLTVLVRAVQYAWMADMELSDALIDKVRKQIRRGCKDFSEGNRLEYVLRPSVFFPNFHLPFFFDVFDILKLESVWLMETPNADGTWPVPWSWYQFEDEFEKIKPEWMSDMIVKNLRLIHRMNKESVDV